MDASSQIFGHLSRVYCVYASFLKEESPFLEFNIVIQFTAVLQTSCPGEDTGNGVCAGGVALKVTQTYLSF